MNTESAWPSSSQDLAQAFGLRDGAIQFVSDMQPVGADGAGQPNTTFSVSANFNQTYAIECS